MSTLSNPFIYIAVITQSFGNIIFRLLSFIIVFIGILLSAYLTTKFVATRSSNFSKAKHIKVIEKTVLGVDKSLLLVNVGTSYYIIAVGKQNIQLIDKINKEDLPNLLRNHETDSNNVEFDFYLNKLTQESDNKHLSVSEYRENLIEKLTKIKGRNTAIDKLIDKDE